MCRRFDSGLRHHLFFVPPDAQAWASDHSWRHPAAETPQPPRRDGLPNSHAMGYREAVELGVSGKTAMVAASSKGIGFACARALASEGAAVSLCGRNEDSLRRASGELSAEFPRARVLWTQCDVTDPTGLTTWYENTWKQLGPPDILITNTGGPPTGSLEEIDDSKWHAGYEATILTAFRLTNLVTAHMKESGWGRVVHLSSVVAYDPNEMLAISTTLRTGLRALTRLQSDLLAPYGITVNSVLPGHTFTERQTHLARVWSEKTGDSEAKYFEKMSQEIPVRRLAQPHEIADVVAFLCSERACYVTGESILVDGGLARSM